MRNIIILCVALCICMLNLSCNTTPKSITSISGVQLQYLSAAQTDAEDIVNTYDAELRNWVRNAFRFALQDLEKQITSPDGTVNLEQYKQTISTLTTQAASVMATYDIDKAKALNNIDSKYRKIKMVQMLIDEYERSTGTSPETLQALMTEMQATYSAVEPLFNKPDEAQNGNTWETQLDMVTRGLYERVRQTVTDRLTGGLVPLAPAPIESAAPAQAPIVPTE